MSGRIVDRHATGFSRSYREVEDLLRKRSRLAKHTREYAMMSEQINRRIAATRDGKERRYG
jgi:hypothetical protein